MKVFIDDKRPAPEGWILVDSFHKALDFFEEHGEQITHASFDHYLSDVMPGHNGIELVRYLKHAIGFDFTRMPKENWTGHSGDSYMAERLEKMIHSYYAETDILRVDFDLEADEPAIRVTYSKTKPVKKKKLVRH